MESTYTHIILNSSWNDIFLQIRRCVECITDGLVHFNERCLLSNVLWNIYLCFCFINYRVSSGITGHFWTKLQFSHFLLDISLQIGLFIWNKVCCYKMHLEFSKYLNVFHVKSRGLCRKVRAGKSGHFSGKSGHSTQIKIS